MKYISSKIPQIPQRTSTAQTVLHVVRALVVSQVLSQWTTNETIATHATAQNDGVIILLTCMHTCISSGDSSSRELPLTAIGLLRFDIKEALQVGPSVFVEQLKSDVSLHAVAMRNEKLASRLIGEWLMRMVHKVVRFGSPMMLRSGMKACQAPSPNLSSYRLTSGQSCAS